MLINFHFCVLEKFLSFSLLSYTFYDAHKFNQYNKLNKQKNGKKGLNQLKLCIFSYFFPFSH